MAQKRKNKQLTASKIVNVAMMMSLLLFLTVVNYFVYPPDGNGPLITSIIPASEEAGREDFPGSANPTEEKTPGPSILEEYLPDHHINLNAALINKIFQHRILEAEKTLVAHFELISPPPERSMA